jgi:hypothetical protein
MVSLRKFLGNRDPREIEDSEIILEASELASRRTLRLSLTAWPWWQKPLPHPDARASLTLELTGILASRWPPRWGTCRISELSVATSGYALRTFGPWQQVYGASPIPDPHRFFLEFYDTCISLQTVQDPLQYTGRQRFSEFERFVSKNSYFMLDAPEEVIAAARPLLDARNVRYSCVPGREPHPDHQKLVQVMLDDRWVVCRSATVTMTSRGGGRISRARSGPSPGISRGAGRGACRRRGA